MNDTDKIRSSLEVMAEVTKLRETILTCRELREHDRIKIEQLSNRINDLTMVLRKARAALHAVGSILTVRAIDVALDK